VIVCALGDLMLDLIVRIERPLARGDDTPALTRAGAGGQAANVAAWAATLGAQSRLIAKWGGDTPGRLVAAEVGARRVEVLGPMAPGRNGVVVSIVEPGGERSMLSDPGVAAELSPEDLEPEWLAGVDALYVSGYALLRDPVGAAAEAAARTVRADGGVVSVDLSTWSSIRAFGADRFLERIASIEPDVVFATELELDELPAAPEAGTIVLKRGPAGAVVRQGGRDTEHDSRATEIADSTGAGDALAAGFLVGGIELGLETAARCVAKLGAMP
jgi:sugar/nucleoside kinase (ribokinase family)